MSTLDSHIPKFKRCVIQNFPFIEETFDALTNYALISKVVEYLNKIISSQNEVIDTTNNLQESFAELREYTEHFFDNVPVILNEIFQNAIRNGDITASLNAEYDSTTEELTLNIIATNGDE